MNVNKIVISIGLLAVLSVAVGGAVFGQSSDLPPAETDAMARLNNSPRHGEWVVIDAGGEDKVDACKSRFGVVGYCWGGGISFGYATSETV